ncbi:TerC family protein [Larkinella insperata]|uniref:TerC family protein n=1 Tax=Larkinella insperata TaxID=332158 RepID=A0ABW3QKU7_9BACT
MILLAGELFLIYKSTKKSTTKLRRGWCQRPDVTKAGFRNLLIQVVILDIVFSFDSIITAVGMVSQPWVMYTVEVVTVAIMLIASWPIAHCISRQSFLKILALCFLLIIGMSLVAEGLHFEIPKGYIYFSMAFAFLVDVIQMKTVPPTPRH